MSEVVKKSNLELVLSGAAALQARELSKKAMQELKGIAEPESDSLPISAVYELAEDVLRLPREYVDAYIQTRFPSVQRQLKTVGELKAKPTVGSALKTFTRELICSLEEASPLEKFYARTGSNEYNNEYFWATFYRKEGILAFLTSKKLAELNLLGSTLIIEDPFFAEACMAKIKQLDQDLTVRGFNIKKISYKYSL